jgi:alkylation response protein AidB-like acyl-CoA dehydrogenase
MPALTPTTALEAADRAAERIATFAHEADTNAAFPTNSVAILHEAGLTGLLSAVAVGGSGLGYGDAAQVVARIARACGSTAMILTMHYSATAVIERFAPEAVRRDIALGKHLSTLAFSEAGSRSHFWAPTSTASATADGIQLSAHKSWVTSARHADSYVWSSRPISGEAPSTLWLVPRLTAGLFIEGRFDGIGLRGNDSTPIRAQGVMVPGAAMLGIDGGGFDIMMGTVLPLFCLCSAACSVGFMDEALARTASHAAATRHEDAGSSLADLPTIRAYVAKAQVQAEMARCLWLDAIAAVTTGRPDAMLRVLQVKAAANEAAVEVTQQCMRICGGAAFRREQGIDRQFRDARAGFIMAPTSDQLFDFIGKAVTGLPLF